MKTLTPMDLWRAQVTLCSQVIGVQAEFGLRLMASMQKAVLSSVDGSRAIWLAWSGLPTASATQADTPSEPAAAPSGRGGSEAARTLQRARDLAKRTSAKLSAAEVKSVAGQTPGPTAGAPDGPTDRAPSKTLVAGPATRSRAKTPAARRKPGTSAAQA